MFFQIIPSPTFFVGRGSGKSVTREPGETLFGFLYGVQTTFVSKFRLAATAFPKMPFYIKQKDVFILAKYNVWERL